VRYNYSTVHSSINYNRVAGSGELFFMLRVVKGICSAAMGQKKKEDPS